jgi:hypothetical protein
VRAHCLAGSNHIIERRRNLVVADVVEDAAGEQEWLLQHHGHLLAQRFLGDVAHVVPADEHRA